MSSVLTMPMVRLDSSWFLGLGFVLFSIVVVAQTAADRLDSSRTFDDVVIDQIQEDAGLWRQEPESSEPQWRPAAEPKHTESRITWGYDSTYEQLRTKQDKAAGRRMFDYDDERTGTLFRYNF